MQSKNCSIIIDEMSYFIIAEQKLPPLMYLNAPFI